MASNLSPGSSSNGAAARELEQKPNGAKRNMSRSEEDDSDDSGVIKDVSRRGAPPAPDDGARRGVEDSAESEVSLNSETVSSPVRADRPPKKSYLDFIEQTPKVSPSKPGLQGLRFNVGDLVWGRSTASYYHPAVVTQDPHFKFHTKIVKSEPGSSAVDHETGKLRGFSAEEPCRQYHLQQLGDNRRLWVASNLIIPFTGIADYEQLAIQDVKNINKIYKPKTEAAKVSWREAVLIAQQLEPMEPAERVKKCDWARLREIGGPALQKKLEYDNRKRAEEEAAGPARKDGAEAAEKFKSPSSPRKGLEEVKGKSDQTRRKEEMDYKMFRMSSMQKKSEDKKRKRQRSEGGSSGPDTGSPVKAALAGPVQELSPITTFSRSFKVKKDVVKKDLYKEEYKEEVKEEVAAASPGRAEAAVANGGGGDVGPVGKGGDHTDMETETAADGLGEGTLVWAKMRGYSFWPCVVSRDPEGGEFVKFPDSLSKSQKKIHVLFLEYNNQRAWIQLGSIKTYNGVKDFKEQKASASKSKKKDFEPGKRYEGQFERALDYAEELAKLTDDDRLEQVLLRYGWVMVEDQELDSADGPRKKKRRTIKPDPNRMSELNKSTATDSEADKEMEAEPAAVSAPRPAALSSDRRSSAEAESRLDPAPDPPSPDCSPATSKKKRTSSVIASFAINGDSSSTDAESDGGESRRRRSKQQPKKKKAETSGGGGPPAVRTVPTPAAASVPTAAAMKALAGEEEFPRVGDLVWGRMPGFPFWPCFVTRSPQGQYCKDGGKGKMMYHVQFFNWNDESGWVNTAIEFDGLESFKKLAAKKKSDKSYHPTKGAMSAKWEKAAREAEETMGLTRQERAEQYIVIYGAQAASKPAAKPKPSPKPPAARPKTASGPKKPATPAATPPARRTPGPASKTGRPVVPLPKRPVEAPLPTGWRTSGRGASQTFIAPDGREFLDRAAALAYAAEGPGTTEAAARYLQDRSLPTGWRVQSIQDRIYYFSPRGERFESRDAVADRLAEEGLPAGEVERARAGQSRRAGPRSAMLRLGEVGYHGEEEPAAGEDQEETDPASILRLPNGLNYRKGGQMDPYLDLDKLFDPSNGGMIEMVQLPDIFLDHPTVSVTESDNEMVISDVDTGEFIAKKIIYD